MTVQQNIEKFLRINDIHMKSIELAVLALTHPSCSQENPNHDNNQRLEFLGDAILDFVIGEYLYRNYPEFKEGNLTQIRSGLVCEHSLYEIAQHLRIGEFIILGRGEEHSGGRDRCSSLADTVESLIGAIYLDSGLDSARDFVLREMGDRLKGLTTQTYMDYKSTLQETVQRVGTENVVYKLLEMTGPAHNRYFVSGVYYKDNLLGIGSGRTKKLSEQHAAQIAFEKIEKKEIELL